MAPNTLTPFDGKDVLSAGIAIRNAGDGLSEALSVDPQEFHHGEKVYVVLECEVDKVRFDPVKDSDGLRRVHVFKAGTATIVDESIVATQLDDQRRKIEAAAGVRRLEFDEELSAQHREGEHDETPHADCPMCAEAKAGDPLADAVGS